VDPLATNIKGGPWRRRCTTHIHELLHLAALLYLLATGRTLAAGLSSLTPVWPPEGLRRRRNHQRCMLSCCRVSDPCPKPSTSASWLEMGFRESSRLPYVCEYAEVPLVQCRSRCSKIFTTLRSTTSSSLSTLVRERNPRISVYEGTGPNSYRYSITNR
jgi:hypothetical protein